MNLFDMLQQGQNGSAFSAMARQFGISEDQVGAAVEAMMPAFSTGLKRNTAAADGMADFLRAVSSGSHAGYFDNVSRAMSGDGIADGNAILGHLFGSKDVSRAVAAQAEAATGIGQDILKQMLPVMADMVMGSLAKQSQDSTGSPLGAFMEQFAGGPDRVRPPGDGPLDRYEQEQSSASPFTEMMDQFMGGAMGDNPFAKMFEQFAGTAGQEQLQQRMFGDMLDTGRQLGDEYQKNMESIFDRYLKDLNRA